MTGTPAPVIPLRCPRRASAHGAAGRTHVHRHADDAAGPGPGHGCDGCLVRHMAVCNALPHEEVASLQHVVSDVHLQAGQMLAREGDARRYVYTVTSGALRRIRELPDGRRLVAGFLMPGDFIGFSSSERYRHSLEAVAESSLCAFSQPDMARLRAQYPNLERELLERACVELDATRDNLMALARMNPIERLSGFLLDMAARRRRQGESDTEVVLPMTRSDIADYLGLTVETVSRSFTRLRHEGVIATDDPQHVRLLDRARLQALAEARG